MEIKCYVVWRESEEEKKVEMECYVVWRTIEVGREVEIVFCSL